MIEVIITIAVICLVVYALTTLIPMPANIAKIIWAVAGLLILLLLLRVLGVTSSTPIPTLRWR